MSVEQAMAAEAMKQARTLAEYEGISLQEAAQRIITALTSDDGPRTRTVGVLEGGEILVRREQFVDGEWQPVPF